MPTVMVVEDSVISRQVISRLLKREGYHTLQASGGQEALTMLAGSGAPDLILLDVMMPDLDGLDLLERLHENPLWRNIPVIMLTALSDTHTVHRAQQLGAREFLVKAAFSVAEMMTHVKRYTQYQPH